MSRHSDFSNFLLTGLSTAFLLLVLHTGWGVSVTTEPSVQYAVNCTVIESTPPSPPEKKLTFGVILPLRGSYYWTLEKTRSAIQYAIDTVRDTPDLLPGWDIQADFRDSMCSGTDGPLEAIDMYTKRTAHVFLGPACDYAVAPIARFTNRWEIPVITAGALAKAFEDKQEYRLLTRLMGSYAKSAEFFIEIAGTFNWKTVGMIYHDFAESMGRSDCYFTVEAFFIALNNHNGGKKPWYTHFDETRKTDFEILLRQASLHTRIVVLCASPDSVREIMIKAHELHFDNGEYVFFNIDLFTSKNASERPWYRADDTDERNEKARKAYEALMTVTLQKPTSPEYRRFSAEVKRRAERMYAADNFTYGEEEVNIFVGAFHDAVILYALALNESLQNNVTITEGSEITRRMWNRTFEGITGTVRIDANGDRNADYSLLDLDPATNKFHVVANYYGNRKKYEPVEGRTIVWAGGMNNAPPDTPVCGFDKSKCPPEKPFPDYGIVIIVLGSIILIVLVAALFIYSHQHVEGLTRVSLHPTIPCVGGPRGKRRKLPWATTSPSNPWIILQTENLQRPKDNKLGRHL